MASLFSTLQRSLKGLLILVPVLIGLVMASPAEAVRWDAETLTVPGNPERTQVTFSEQEINTGRKVHSTSCGTSNAGDLTQTSTNSTGASVRSPVRDSCNVEKREAMKDAGD